MTNSHLFSSLHDLNVGIFSCWRLWTTNLPLFSLNNKVHLFLEDSNIRGFSYDFFCPSQRFGILSTALQF